MANIQQVSSSNQADIGQVYKFFVYIIQGKFDYYYCGFSGKLVQRLQAHNQKKGKSTRTHAPYVLKYLVEADSRLQARRIEKMIKAQGVRKYYMKRFYSKDFKVTQNLIADIFGLPQQPTANSQQPLLLQN